MKKSISDVRHPMLSLCFFYLSDFLVFRYTFYAVSATVSILLQQGKEVMQGNVEWGNTTFYTVVTITLISLVVLYHCRQSCTLSSRSALRQCWLSI